MPLGCEGPATVRDLGVDSWQDLVENGSAAKIVYAWASWSRESVELLPTIIELEREHEGRGVEFLYVSLDVDDPADAEQLMRELNGPTFYRIAAPIEEAVFALGISEPPAIIAFREGIVRSTIEGESASPENAQALVEALVADQL